MKALIIADAHLYQTSDGKVWTKTIYGNDFWNRYLNVFESIAIVARMCKANYDDVKGFLRVDGENIEFKPMPMARGGKEYIIHLQKILQCARLIVNNEKCAIIRLPSIIGTFIYPYILKKHIPHGIEVVANPYEAFTNPIIKWYLTKQLKNAALNANGVAYVTKYALQRQYPSYARINGEDELHFEEYYSSITLDTKFIGLPKKFKNKKKFKLVHTSNSISNDQKGHSVVIKTIKILRNKGFDVEVDFIGDGPKRADFEVLASKLQINEYVHFVGWLSSSNEVRKVLNNCDIFIFPSYSEGLPRAVIEAMAVGLPCVASCVGGIPELLSEDFLCDPKDIEGFSGAIERLITNFDLMEEESIRNIKKATEYTIPVLQARRNDFYTKIKNIAERIN